MEPAGQPPIKTPVTSFTPITPTGSSPLSNPSSQGANIEGGGAFQNRIVEQDGSLPSAISAIYNAILPLQEDGSSAAFQQDAQFNQTHQYGFWQPPAGTSAEVFTQDTPISYMYPQDMPIGNPHNVFAVQQNVFVVQQPPASISASAYAALHEADIEHLASKGKENWLNFIKSLSRRSKLRISIPLDEKDIPYTLTAYHDYTLHMHLECPNDKKAKTIGKEELLPMFCYARQAMKVTAEHNPIIAKFALACKDKFQSFTHAHEGRPEYKPIQPVDNGLNIWNRYINAHDFLRITKQISASDIPYMVAAHEFLEQPLFEHEIAILECFAQTQWQIGNDKPQLLFEEVQRRKNRIPNYKDNLQKIEESIHKLSLL